MFPILKLQKIGVAIVKIKSWLSYWKNGGDFKNVDILFSIFRFKVGYVLNLKFVVEDFILSEIPMMVSFEKKYCIFMLLVEFE